MRIIFIIIMEYQKLILLVYFIINQQLKIINKYITFILLVFRIYHKLKMEQLMLIKFHLGQYKLSLSNQYSNLLQYNNLLFNLILYFYLNLIMNLISITNHYLLHLQMGYNYFLIFRIMYYMEYTKNLLFNQVRIFYLNKIMNQDE